MPAIRSNSAPWTFLAALLLAVPVACSSESDLPSGAAHDAAAGDLGLALSLAPGENVNAVSYTIIGPSGFSKAGTIDVSTSTALMATIAGLPAGSGFTISLTATTADGATSCSGSASFSIVAHATTNVSVHLLCREAPRTGAVSVNGVLNTCPAIDGISANPAEVTVGGSIALDVQAHDADAGPAALSYGWSATSGSFNDATARSPIFTCTQAGVSTLSVTVSDGDNTLNCPAKGSMTITCSGSTGSGGAAGGAGSAGASGGGAGGTSGGAGASSGGAAGVSGGAGTSGIGGTSGTAGSSAGGGGTSGSSGGAAAVAVAVYRVGDGTGSLVSTGNAVFVDEYSADGVLVRAIPMPTTATSGGHRLVASGTATSEGLLTRSSDGAYLVLTGYDATPPATGGLSGTTSVATPRTIARVNAAGDVDTSTALTDAASANNPRSAASSNGSDLWFAGASGGVRYTTLGSSTSLQLSTTVANIRQVAIFGAQLFVSDSSGSTVRLGSVGAGLPTTAGQSIVNLPGLPSSTGSPYGFFLADLDAGTPGLDTLYVADDSAGIIKYSLVGSSWVTNGTLGAASDAYRGLAGSASGSTVTLYAVGQGGSGAAGGGQLVRLVDSTGYAGAFAPSRVVLASAAANTAFRGVALTPDH